MEELILGEVNVKSIDYLTDTEGFIKKKIKPNFKSLGARMGARMKEVAAAISTLGQAEIAAFEQSGKYNLIINNDHIDINISDVEIIAEDIPGWSVANKDNLTVALDITISPSLLEEGHARELVNRLQKIRKDSGLDLTDRIIVNIQIIESLKSAIINFKDYICAEILADDILYVSEIENGTEIEINDEELKVKIIKQ